VIAAVRCKHVGLDSSPIKQVLVETLNPAQSNPIQCDDVINDVIRPGSTMREDHICTPYKGTLYSIKVSFVGEEEAF